MFPPFPDLDFSKQMCSYNVLSFSCSCLSMCKFSIKNNSARSAQAGLCYYLAVFSKHLMLFFIKLLLKESVLGACGSLLGVPVFPREY